MLYTWWNAHWLMISMIWCEGRDYRYCACPIQVGGPKVKLSLFVLFSQLDSPLFQRLNTQVWSVAPCAKSRNQIFLFSTTLPLVNSRSSPSHFLFAAKLWRSPRVLGGDATMPILRKVSPTIVYLYTLKTIVTRSINFASSFSPAPKILIGFSAKLHPTNSKWLLHAHL